jgi:16S rRNA (uracil1498-N3)-methyltransferase
MSERFYVDAPLHGRPQVELRGPEAHHLATVCRLRPGDALCLFNGDGREYAAVVEAVGRQAVALRLTAESEPARELVFALEVAAPLPRGDRAQFLVEKLTELGAERFVPLVTRHSAAQARQGRPEKLERYVIEASKQCGRNRLMQVAPPAEWPDYCRAGPPRQVRVLAHPTGEPPARALELLRVLAGASLSVAVGPEGGFTDEEIEQARAAGWLALGLGPRILRVETAALVLAAWAVAANPDAS